MSKEAVASATPVAKEPTVSVAEAMGLPTDWSMKSSITPGLKSSASSKDDDEDTADDDDDSLPSEGKDESEKTTETEPAPKTETPPAAPAKEKKPAAAKEKKPAAPAKPATEPAPAAPAAAAKIKIKDKEYTPEELEAFIAKANAPAAPAAPAKPAEPAPAPVAKKEPTAEETKLQEEETKKKDAKWVSDYSPNMTVPVDEPTLEKILTGGPEGVAAFKKTISETVAHAVLATRKAIYSEMLPRFETISNAQMPLLEAQAKAEDEKAWNSFKEAYPDLENFKDLVETAANTLVEKNPGKYRDASSEDFYKDVATHVRTFTERFKPAAPAAPAAAAPGQTAPAAPAAGTAPAAPAAPAATAKAKVAPPGANVPTSGGAGTGKKKGGDSDIIAGLM